MKLISSFPALVYDPEHKIIVKVVRAIDDEGREWESYNDGPYAPVEPPNPADFVLP